MPAAASPQTRRVGGALRRDRRVWITRAVVAALLVAYVVILYLAAVLAGRALLGTRPGAGGPLTVLAAAVAALTLEPLGGRLRRRLPELPQDRLTRLARGAVAADDLPEVLRSTARLVQEGLGAASVEITTAGTSAATARWPSQALLDGTETAHITPLTRSGNPLGHLAVAMPAGVGVSPGTGRSSRTSASTSRPSCRRRSCATRCTRRCPRPSCGRVTCALRGSDSCWHRSRAGDAWSATSTTAPSSTSSRSRCTSGCCGPLSRTGRRHRSPSPRSGDHDGPDGGRVRARRRRGAVPRPVPSTPRRARARRGARAGGRGGPLHVTVRGRDVQRVDPDVEAAVYFCCLEAVQNAVKHARAHRVDVRLAVRAGCVTFTVSDDGDGFAAPRTGAEAGGGTGMQNMRDRLEALGGALDVASVPGAGTTVSGDVPFPAAGPGSGYRHLAPRHRRLRGVEMRAARHAWAVVVVTAALAVAQAFLLAAAGVPLWSAEAVSEGFPGIPLATVVGALVGAVILSRHPRHRIGWLFCLGQLGVAVGLRCPRRRQPRARRRPLPRGRAHGRVGRRPARRRVRADAARRPAPAGAGRPAAIAAVAAGAAARARLVRRPRRHAAHPFPPSKISAAGQMPATATVEWLVTVANAGVFAGLVAGAAAVVVRLRRARGEERQQMRWIAVAAVGLAVVPVVALAVNLAGRPTPAVLVLALQVAYLAVPLATGFAVLRYRLYDVDRVIGGAVVLTAVVVVASAGYLVAVASVGRIAEGRGRPSWLALGAFVAVVLLLQPVRRVAGRAADRLVYGPRAARYAVLVAHSDQLADAAAGASFLAGVAETTARLMGASSCRAAVRLDDGSEVSEVWPPGTPGPGASGKGALEVTVRSDGVDVGRLVLEQRQQARPSASRRRVLREFCERAGPAFATTGLEESLRAGATRLARVNADLAASRQRLLAADDSGRRQVAAAIRVGVVTGLREVPDRLSAVAAATRSDPPAAVGLVDACIATTAEALEELREITRAISPPLLAQRGLPAALRARGGRVHVANRPRARRTGGPRTWRPPPGSAAPSSCGGHGATSGSVSGRTPRGWSYPRLRAGRRPGRRPAGGGGRPGRGARRHARAAGAGSPADVPGQGAGAAGPPPAAAHARVRLRGARVALGR